MTEDHTFDPPEFVGSGEPIGSGPRGEPAGRRELLGVRDDRGQTTAEYALVLVGVAVVAAAFMTWAGGSGRIADLFEAVMARILSGV